MTGLWPPASVGRPSCGLPGLRPRRLRPRHTACAGTSSPADQATAAVLYKQLQFAAPADAGAVNQEDQEERLVLSPERPAWLEEPQCRIGELTREAPKAKR